MTLDQYTQFIKEYYGDLDYTKMDKASFKKAIEAKEKERLTPLIQELINEGKFDEQIMKNLHDNCELTIDPPTMVSKSDNITATLKYKGVVIAQATHSFTVPGL